ncbi:hypothetical protein ANCCAN_10279 [Ancylostoma caninum]|uniref:Uncharacterized protein n=1 Tax=Ancylostoma caninum TaxID=29170 RepID=A0A368GL48_ANCCA|nr:hypothetical protein ANCCAN_10279 [Ancylostoma caninum]
MFRNLEFFFQRKTCRTALQRGRNVIENTAPALVQEETTRFRRKVSERIKEMMNAEVFSPESLTFIKYVEKYVVDAGPGTTLPPCPEPNRTMFTTLAPSTVRTTTVVTSCSSTAASTTAGTTGTAGTPASAQTAISSARTTSTGAAVTLAGTTGAGQTTTDTAQSASKSATTVPVQTTTESTTNQAVSEQKERLAVDDGATQATTPGDGSTVVSTSSEASSSAASSSQPTDAATVSSGAGTSSETPACGAQDTVEGSKRSFVMPTLYSSAPESDPFYSWMNSIYVSNQSMIPHSCPMREYMFKEEEICDQPQFKDLNSITEDQLYGFLATLSAVHPGPFCSLCDRFMNELRERVFVVNPLWGVSFPLYNNYTPSSV